MMRIIIIIIIIIILEYISTHERNATDVRAAESPCDALHKADVLAKFLPTRRHVHLSPSEVHVGHAMSKPCCKGHGDVL